MLKTKTSTRHWLDKAKPKYWTTRKIWRVRVMHDGQPLEWRMKSGKGDSGPTGYLLALAEWNKERQTVIAAEQPEYDESGMFINFRSKEEEDEFYRFYQERDDYKASALSSEMTFEEWREYQEYRSWQASKLQSQLHASAPGSNAPTVLPAAKGAKPFKELTAVFLAHLRHRRAQTKPGLKSKKDISQSRLEQYEFALAHLDAKLGGTPAEPVGEFHVGEKQMTTILQRYREKCEEEMVASKFSGHWFNERMKAARALVTFLLAHRLLSAEPPNVASLTEKYQIEPDPKPIPLPVLRAFWDAADDEFRGYMLIALNCGFRQTEIHSLNRKQLKMVSKQDCIVKLRGKTGQPIALPLWAATGRFIAKFANKDGVLFNWKDSEEAMYDLYHRLKRIREQVAKTLPGASEYSFENFRDTGASYMDTVNPMLTPLYLGHGDNRQAKQYVATIKDENGQAMVPMQLDTGLAMFEKYLALPTYEP